MTDANRWLLYAALFAILVLLLRDDRLSKVSCRLRDRGDRGVGLYLACRLVVGDGAEPLPRPRSRAAGLHQRPGGLPAARRLAVGCPGRTRSDLGWRGLESQARRC